MIKLCSVKFNVDGGSSNKEYSYKTNISDLKENEIVIVETGKELSRARFIKYIDSVDFPVNKLKSVVERFDGNV